MSPRKPSVPEAPTRPRVEGDREQEILDATLAVLVDVGYDRLTMDAVATQAKASKATLYRKWDGKAALVIDALMSEKTPLAAPQDTGSLRGDDIAGLVLDRDPPAGTAPASLSAAPARPGLQVGVFGYPEMPPRPDGAWVSATVRGTVGKRAKVFLKPGRQSFRVERHHVTRLAGEVMLGVEIVGVDETRKQDTGAQLGIECRRNATGAVGDDERVADGIPPRSRHSRDCDFQLP